MWSSGGEENSFNSFNTLSPFNPTNNYNTSVSCSSFSKSSSSSSSFSSPLPTQSRKTMEDVWKHISLTSLQETPTRGHLFKPTPNALQGMKLQDFLARPFSKDSPTTVALSHSTLNNRNVSHFGSPPPPPPAATTFNLNSGPDQFHYIVNSPNPTMDNPFFGAFAANVICPTGKKRHSEPEDIPGDHRRKRMIKNRESAARSRARKQAHTNQLELEITQLNEEIARLKENQKEFEALAAAAALHPRKCSLYRTSTAPF